MPQERKVNRSGPRDAQWTQDEIKAMETENAPPLDIRFTREALCLAAPVVDRFNQIVEDRIARWKEGFNASSK